MYRPRTDKHALESFFFKLPDTLLMVFGADWSLRQISEAWANALGFTEEELLLRCFFDLLHEDDCVASHEKLSAMSRENPTLRFSSRCRRRDGTFLGVTWNVSFDADERMYFASAHETAYNLSGDDAHLPDVFVDGLTGLPNRSLFLDRLAHTLKRSERRKELQFAVLYCGLDRFKVVNHSLGHRMGDLLLMNVAEVIRNTIRPTDMAARLAGDEFALLLEDIRDISATLLVVSRIQDKLKLPFSLDDHEVFTSISFGIVTSGDVYRSPDEMLRDANMAMVRSKALGGGGYVVFNQEMHDRAVRRMALEMDMRHAVERGEFQAYYQPIVSLGERRLAGFEALVRWNHPTRGLVSPVDFIPLAEETGLIVQIGRWMLREACRQARDWQVRLPERQPLTVSVNLSARQLLHPGLIDEVTAALAESGLPPELLKLEITESAMMENAETAIALLEQLRAMNIRLLLDDFGTG
jgi:diguanylate cyclase (GGDEF)-like protein/PAS domain S-box-containing protein